MTIPSELAALQPPLMKFARMKWRGCLDMRRLRGLA